MGRDAFMRLAGNRQPHSIHAPRMGRDVSFGFFTSASAVFQSTRPVWGATDVSSWWASLIAIFQSTRPVWGATHSSASCKIYWFYFNPRAPYGARPSIGSDEWSEKIFQSTRPVWGATYYRRTHQQDNSISIHAPRMGRDSAEPSSSRQASDFNPRAPYGARPLQKALSGKSETFQSTRPVWGATVLRLSAIYSSGDFNPRAPYGARHDFYWPVFANLGISIHAPRMGRDVYPQLRAPPVVDFNPRAPYGARRFLIYTIAPLIRFQSTRPVWGATYSSFSIKL